jgi:hypothetical protein
MSVCNVTLVHDLDAHPMHQPSRHVLNPSVKRVAWRIIAIHIRHNITADQVISKLIVYTNR